MKKQTLTKLALSVPLALGLSGCQFFFPVPKEPEVEAKAATEAVRVTAAAPFEEGEAFEGRVYIEDVAAGDVSLRVGSRCTADGKVALPVEGKGHLGGILSVFGSGDAETAALIDLDASLPLEAKWDFSADEKRSFVELDYASGRYRMHALREEPDKQPANTYRRVDLATEQTPHDGHSMLGYLRRWNPPQGTKGFLYVVVGKNLIRADVSLTGREKLHTELGDFEAVRIDGTATRVAEKTLEPIARFAPKPFSMWLTDDEERVPLRIVVATELANLKIDLAKHTKGAVTSGAPQPCAVRVDKKALAKARKPRKPKAQEGVEKSEAPADATPKKRKHRKPKPKPAPSPTDETRAADVPKQASPAP